MTGSGFSSNARHQAQDILSRPPFRTTPDHPPRPLAGVFHALGRALNAVFGRPARWVYHHILIHIGRGFHAAFGGWWPYVAGCIALAVGVALGVLVARRRSRVGARQMRADDRGAQEDPGELEGQASQAEARGDHERAVRLRFRAGLLRLAAKGTLADHESRTDRELSSVLSSETFARLAVRHEQIAYGRDPATPSDSSDARHGWPRVFAEVGAGETTDR